jgi:hypothetical protein
VESGERFLTISEAEKVAWFLNASWLDLADGCGLVNVDHKKLQETQKAPTLRSGLTPDPADIPGPDFAEQPSSEPDGRGADLGSITATSKSARVVDERK